jgi:ectoine hydroxylase-related dioxygenase (phytanoyl-CoA dioxygenase family)
VHFDVPRLRTSTSNDYLTTGIAYAFHPHRDTWYSAPPCQLNWWMPVMPITRDNGLAFHPKYWSTPVKNSSNTYDYYEWNATSRVNAAQHIKTDTRVQPKPQEPVELDPQIRIVAPPGGVTIFSAAQLHSSVPNTSGKTRFSIDFRTVHVDDVAAKRGAHNIDSACTGTALRDFLRMRDLERIPDDMASMYDEGASNAGVKIFEPIDD